jgi:hypothetical protein
MELPDPTPSVNLLLALAEIETTSHDWLEISAGLRTVEAETNDLQAGWLMTAFDYFLARRVGTDARNVPAFTPQISTAQFQYPSPLLQIPAEVLALWANISAQPTGSASQARLHHLLFETRQGNAGEHGRAAATAYVVVGTTDWSRIERANCLHWALDLFRRIKDTAGAEAIHEELVELANESMSQQESFEPGVALHAIEVLAFDAPDYPALPDILAQARTSYSDARLTNETIRIQLQIAKGDRDRTAELHREQVQSYLNEADASTGMIRMANLEDAAELASRLGLPELHKDAVNAMQAMSIDDMDLKKTSFTIDVPTVAIQEWIDTYLGRASLRDALQAIADGTPPTGTLGDTKSTAAATAKAAPFYSMITKRHIGPDGLTRYTATTDTEREDEHFAQVENMHMAIAKDGFAHILDGIMNKFSPTKDELVDVLTASPLVDSHTASSIANAITAFHDGQYEAAATMAMPKIETLARARLASSGELQFKPQRGTKRGQYPQLGSMLRTMQSILDPSWYRFLWTFLVSPFGPNYRNALAHGFLGDVGGHEAGLVIVAALHLSLASDPGARRTRRER